MAYANYPEFREAVMTFIVGDEPGSSTAINTQTVDTLIRLGESRVYYGDEVVPGLRSRQMVVQWDSLGPVIVDNDNTRTIPLDCIEFSDLRVSGGAPIEFVPLDRIYRLLDANGEGGGSGHHYAAWRGDDKLVFYPNAAGAFLKGGYYARPASMVDSWSDSGPIVNLYPELFIYAALSEAAPFLGEDDRLPMWISMFRSWMKAAQRTEDLRVYNGSPLRMRAR